MRLAAGLGTFEDAVDGAGRALEEIEDIWAVERQTAGIGEWPVWINAGQLRRHGKIDDPLAFLEQH
jgi:hypothetical protein